MNALDLNNTLADAATEVLETMFFTCVESTTAPEFDCGPVASIAFRGSRSGFLRVQMSRPAVTALASEFLGASPATVSALKIDEIVTEFANMVCGAVLTKIEPGGEFYLSEVPEASAGLNTSRTARKAYSILDVGCGTIEMDLEVGAPHEG